MLAAGPIGIRSPATGFATNFCVLHTVRMQLTTSQAARALELSAGRIRQLAESGELEIDLVAVGATVSSRDVGELAEARKRARTLQLVGAPPDAA